MDGKIRNNADEGNMETALPFQQSCRPCREGMGKDEKIRLLFSDDAEHALPQSPGNQGLDDGSLFVSLRRIVQQIVYNGK